jgi:DNA-3-methyladenine glycosylase II
LKDFTMSFVAQHVRDARNHLRKSDFRLRDVIQQIGPFTARVRRDRFAALAEAIVAQQISGKAARSIWNRLVDSSGGKLTAEALCDYSAEQLRACGVSAQKASYLGDLARRVADGSIDLSRIGRRTTDDVVAELTQVRGIGRWTAQMFLIFSLGRLDILPVDDQGIRTAVMKLYALNDTPTVGQLEQIALPWRPYASVASWYLWRWLEQADQAAGTGS